MKPMISNEEAIQFCQMMNWASDNELIKDMRVKVEARYVFIYALFHSRQVVEASGPTLTDAMKNWTKLSRRVAELSKQINGK